MNQVNHIKALFCRNIFLPVMLLLLLFQLSGLKAQTQQTYPVQVYTQLIPPYSPYIPSYYTGTVQKLRVTLINTDMQQPLVQVYLRMKIVSSSFSLTTPPEVYTPQIELQAGVPLQLSLNDLEVYFKRENMRVSGGQSEFYRTQMLPDNFYRFHFEVYEVGTNRLVSNPNLGFAQAMIAAGEPPVLNLPLKGSAIKESPIPNIMFSWTPRHLNSLAAAYGTEYEISLVEIYDKQVAPEAAFDYSRVLYTETTKSTAFTHTVAQPLLLPGMRYAWRVQAKAREGVDEISVFKNNGYSPVFWFDYTADCNTVQFLGAVYEDGHVNITWQEVGALEYRVEYRKRGTSRWYEAPISRPGLSPVYNLQFGQEYEYRVGTRCIPNDSFQYSDTKAFAMPDRQETGPNCGILPDVNLTNQTPARELQALMPVLVGDFPVFITQVSGSGRFSGEGYVGIPYLQGAQIAVTFKDIVVNTDNRLISGYFETKADAESMGVLIDGYAENDKIGIGDDREAYKLDYAIDATVTGKYKYVDTSKDDIKEGEDYQQVNGKNGYYIVTLTDTEGNGHELKVDSLPATVEDKDGNAYEMEIKEGSNEVILQPDHAYGQWNNIQYMAELKNTIDTDAKDGTKVTKGHERHYFVTDTENRPVIKLQVDSSVYYGYEKNPVDYPCRWFVDSVLVSTDSELVLSGESGVYKIEAKKKYGSDSTIFSMTAVVIDGFEITIHPNSKYDGEYGFDDNRFDEIAWLNGAEYLDNKYPVPFMSLLPGQRVTVEARMAYNKEKITTEDLKNIEVAFRPSGNNISVAKEKNIAATTNTLVCKLSEFNNGKMNLDIYNKDKTEKEYINIWMGQKLIGRVDVRVRPPLPATSLRLVKIVINGTIGKDFDIDAKKKELELYLNQKSYNQTFTQWYVKEPEILNLTIDSDTIILADIVKLAEARYEGSSDLFLFFSDTKNSDAYNGWGANTSAIIHINAGIKTSIHELGHIHRLSDIGGGHKDLFYDTNNFMDYSTVRNMFWKHEWEIIYNFIKEEKWK